jgi:uncharacterized protein YjiS (DUF1127 family)
MSITTHHPMTNDHDTRIFSRIAETFHLWRERRRQRFELARYTERELHDAGISWSEMVYEVEKPFWRG